MYIYVVVVATKMHMAKVCDADDHICMVSCTFHSLDTLLG